MNLGRAKFGGDGIFSELESSDGRFSLITLEHAYPKKSPPGWAPKLQNGIYVCERGMHKLEGMKEPFETFEVTGVSGHTGILFHVGNWNRDSKGCILVGHLMIEMENGEHLITQSRISFAQFMEIQSGVDIFILTVAGLS